MDNQNAVISYAEFTSVCGADITEADFNSYVMPAQSVVVMAARGYDMQADISSNGDNATYRVNYFKRAVAYQTAYMVDSGSKTAQALKDDDYASITVGRTTISKGSSNSGVSSVYDALSVEARAALMLSGLTHSGGVFSDRIQPPFGR